MSMVPKNKNQLKQKLKKWSINKYKIKKKNKK